MLYSKELLWILQESLNSSTWGLSMIRVFSIPRAHILIHANTHKLTIHTYALHNGITKHKQPEATARNGN